MAKLRNYPIVLPYTSPKSGAESTVWRAIGHVTSLEATYEVSTLDRQLYGFGTILSSGICPGRGTTQEQPAVEEAAPQVPEEVLALLNDTRPLTDLSVDELGSRAPSRPAIFRK